MATWENKSFLEKLTSLNKIKIRSKCCNCKVNINEEKVKIVVGGGVGLMVVAALFGLGSGWLALMAAVGGGNTIARMLLQAKVKLAQNAQTMGAYFHCSKCHKDVSIIDVFSQVGEFLGIKL